MDRKEIILLAKSNPRGLLNLIEHGDLKGPDLTESCKVAGFYLPTAMCQRVLLKVLVTTDDPLVFEGALVGLSPHQDEKYRRSLSVVINKTASSEIKEKAVSELEHQKSWDGMGDPDSYEYDDEEEEY
jgi:hypothetical protein